MAEINVNLTINGESDVKEIARALYEAMSKRRPKVESFKNGDKVRLVSLNGALAGFEVGEAVTIKNINNPGSHDFEVKNALGYSGFTNKDNVKKVSADEYEKMAQEQSEKKRWAKIKRKPNEFKEGDAVQYKKSFTTVTQVSVSGIRINQSNNAEKQIEVMPESLTLIFPVEAKFE